MDLVKHRRSLLRRDDRINLFSVQMKFSLKLLFSCIPTLCLSAPLLAQTLPKDELVFLTSEWKGERFPDGRPKVPDNLLARAKNIGIDDAWTVLKNEGYVNQFEGNWKLIKDDVPVVGRAVTALFMPSRPDVEKNIKERGTSQQGRKGNTNAWPIETLTKGDVYVADAFGKIGGGTLMGATLGNAIFSKTGNGVVFNGAARDLQELQNIKGFNAFVRDFHPSFLESTVLMGLKYAHPYRQCHGAARRFSDCPARGRSVRTGPHGRTGHCYL